MKRHLAAAKQQITIHQFHFSATGSDAITNQMFFLRDSLARVGVGGDIFAHHIKGEVVGKIRPMASKEIWNCDLLLVHHSHGNPKLSSLLKVEAPKALVYHNITPAKFLRHDPTQAELCRLGRTQLTQMKPHLVGSFADSKYNSRELEELGYPVSPVLPLYDLAQWLKVNAAAKKIIPKDGPWDLLFVGRVTHHKNQAALLKMFFYLKQFIHPESRLILVGGQDPVYGDYLKLLAESLGLQSSLKFTGKVTDKVLRQYYQNAKAFVSLSQHEGYCIPLVEAMAAGTPVFAAALTGDGETMGKAGVQICGTDPSEIAESIATVLESSTSVEVILRSQKQRLKEILEIQSRARVQELILALVGDLRAGHPAGKKIGARNATKVSPRSP